MESMCAALQFEPESCSRVACIYPQRSSLSALLSAPGQFNQMRTAPKTPIELPFSGWVCLVRAPSDALQGPKKTKRNGRGNPVAELKKGDDDPSPLVGPKPSLSPDEVKTEASKTTPAYRMP